MSYHIEAEEAYDGEDSLSSDDDASWDDQPMLTQSILRAAKELRRDLRRAADKGTFRDRSRPSDFYAPASTGLSNPHTASAPPQASQSPRGHSETTDSLNVHGALMPFQPSQLTRRADDGETDLAPPPLQWGGSTPPTPPQSSQTTAAAQGVGVELVVRMSSPRPKASGRQHDGDEASAPAQLDWGVVVPGASRPAAGRSSAQEATVATASPSTRQQGRMTAVERRRFELTGAATLASLAHRQDDGGDGDAETASGPSPSQQSPWALRDGLRGTRAQYYCGPLSAPEVLHLLTTPISTHGLQALTARSRAGYLKYFHFLGGTEVPENRRRGKNSSSSRATVRSEEWQCRCCHTSLRVPVGKVSNLGVHLYGSSRKPNGCLDNRADSAAEPIPPPLRDNNGRLVRLVASKDQAA